MEVDGRQWCECELVTSASSTSSSQPSVRHGERVSSAGKSLHPCPPPVCHDIRVNAGRTQPAPQWIGQCLDARCDAANRLSLIATPQQIQPPIATVENEGHPEQVLHVEPRLDPRLPPLLPGWVFFARVSVPPVKCFSSVSSYWKFSIVIVFFFQMIKIIGVFLV